MHAHVKKTSRMKTQETQYLQHFNAFRGRGRDVSCLTPPARIRTCTFMHTACMGLSLSRGVMRFWSSFAFHSFVRPAPRAFFRPDRIFPSPSRAAAVKDGAS